MENKPTDNKAKKMWVTLAVLAVILIAVIIAVISSKKTFNQPANTAAVTQSANTAAEQNQPAANVATGTPIQKADETKLYSLTGAKVEIPGASLVTVDKKVVTPEGKIAQNDAIPNTPEAPKPVLINIAQLPKQAINLEIGNGVIKPNTFTVSAGAPVDLAVTSVDGQVHVFIFTNSAVGAIAMGIGGGETKAITFNAPAAGTYEFRCDVPGHSAKGETGRMFVK